MRTNYFNRQSRRSGICVGARRTFRRRIMLSARGLALTAYGHDLARLAVSIADELEPSPEAIARILGTQAAANPARVGARC
jgi:hypothetical protein